MDNLRLILLGIGILILLGIVLLHKPRGPRGGIAASAGPRERREPALSPSHNAGEDAFDQVSVFPLDNEEAEASPAQAKLDAARLAEAEQIITVYVRCRADSGIGGLKLVQAAEKVGLSFGDMAVFHRRLEGQPQPVFSVANLAHPGTFDASAWQTFKSPGLTLFAALPGPQSALATWDAMLAAAERLAELLDGEVLDDGKCLMTRQRIGHMRESMREFDRRHGVSRPSSRD